MKAPDTTLARWIRPEMLLPELRSQNPGSVLEEIAGGMSSADPGLSAPAVFAGLLERESLGTTAVGGGFAIPHCRLTGISRVAVAVARQPLGVDFGAADGLPVHTFFAIVAPRSDASGHLGALGAVARFLRDSGHRQRLAEAAGRDELLELLQGVAPGTEDSPHD